MEREGKGSGLTEGVPSAASSLDDGRRIGSRNTLVGIHTHPSFCLPVSPSLIHTYCFLAGLIPTLTHRYLPSLPSSPSSSCCAPQSPPPINHYNIQYTAIAESFSLLLPPSRMRPYIFTTCSINENLAINPKHC